MSLKNQINKNWDQIKEYMYLGYVSKSKLLSLVSEEKYNDEQMWTFLMACGYASGEKKGIEKISKILTHNKVELLSKAKIWLEVLPFPPHENEGNTHLDLALGMIRKRASTKSGIELCYKNNSWICFCEMKWESDLSVSIKNDHYRNQLARIIENALCFQDENKKYSEKVYITLVTPKVFIEHYKKKGIKTRLYHYKYNDYKKDKSNIIMDIDNCDLNKRIKGSWVYPIDFNKRIKRVNLNWVSFDYLFKNMPETKISKSILEFWKNNGQYLS